MSTHCLDFTRASKPHDANRPTPAWHAIDFNKDSAAAFVVLCRYLLLLILVGTWRIGKINVVARYGPASHVNKQEQSNDLFVTPVEGVDIRAGGLKMCRGVIGRRDVATIFFGIVDRLKRV